MRLLLTLAIINLSACVVAHTHIGDWEYWDGTHFFRLALEQDGVCTLVAGGVAGESEEGIGGRCRYSEHNGSICIDEISDFIDSKPPKKVACEIKFNYENKTDTIVPIAVTEIMRWPFSPMGWLAALSLLFGIFLLGATLGERPHAL